MTDINPTDNPTYDPVAALAQWNSTFNVKSYIEEDSYGRTKFLALRLRLLQEEFKEVTDEVLDAMNGSGDLQKLAKELADLLYVVYGTALGLEIPIKAVFNEVHRSNMSKVGEDGKPVLRPDGKILKGPNYTPPNLDPILGVSL